MYTKVKVTLLNQPSNQLSLYRVKMELNESISEIYTFSKEFMGF